MKTFIFTDKELHIKAVIQAEDYDTAYEILKQQIEDISELIYGGKLGSNFPYFIGN